MSVSHNARVAKLEASLLLTLCENIGSPRAITVYMLASSGQWEDLLALEIDPNHYRDHQSFSDDYLVTSFIQKNQRIPTSFDKKKKAVDKFWDSERRCFETNARLLEVKNTGIFPEADIGIAVTNAQHFISNLLGPLTRSKLSFMESQMRFGPGATTSLSGVVTQGKKYSHRVYDATPRVVDFRTFCFPEVWKQSVKDIRLQHCSKLTTVPKNAKTDRVICIEPDLNIFVQLGTGALIREMLLRSGLDLNTQEWNRYLASKAVDYDLCTMDLSSASDTISREAVWTLLPFEWADLLHFSRVDNTLVDGKPCPLEKWSSMGNGYTFELESLLFYGVVIGCLRTLGLPEHHATAYGDDLIFPADGLDLVSRTLTFLGFSVNHEKTFGKGSFRESCGTDWFEGHNVRPVFLRSDHHDFPTICYIYANAMRRWAHRRNSGESCDSRILPVWLRCFRAVEPGFRHLIPEGFGDVGFVVDFDFAKPTILRKYKLRGWAGYSFEYRRVASVEKEISVQGCLTAFLNGNTSDFSYGVEALRGRFLSPSRGSGYTLVWPNLGPWL